MILEIFEVHVYLIEVCELSKLILFMDWKHFTWT